MNMPTNNYWYLAGPMTGLPKLNFPAFMAAAKQLRSEGHQIWNPAENDLNNGIDPNRPSAKPPLAWFMRIDLPAVCNSHGLFVLPGWRQSPGAQRESIVAVWCGLPVVDYETRKVVYPGIYGGLNYAIHQARQAPQD
jgi:hypothetical protein